MIYYVNSNCIGCGLCVSICPEVFELTEEGLAKAIDKSPPPEYDDPAREARDGCPVSAIESAEE